MTEPHSNFEPEHGSPERNPSMDGRVAHALDGKNAYRPARDYGNPNDVGPNGTIRPKGDVGPNGTLNHTSDKFIKENDILLGHFKVLSCLRGGMGVVYKCEDMNVKNTFVALKTVRTERELTETEVQWMQENFRMVHALRHDHIVSANSLEFDGNYRLWFVVMDWIDGEDLETRLARKKGGRLPANETLRLLRQVADALDYAHAEKKGTIVHRDVKCANIMVRKDEEALLIDFGIAWRTSKPKTPAALDAEPDVADVTWGNLTAVINPFSGTRGYQSPEQWEGVAVTPASDQYSLAVTAYRCLSGHLPFLSANDGQMQELVLHEPVPGIKTLSAETNAVFAKGMAKRAEDRYGSCTEFIEELAKALTGEAVSEIPLEPSPVSPVVTEIDFYLYLDKIEKCHEAIEKGDWDKGQTFGDHQADFSRFWKLAAEARKDHSYNAAYGLLQKAEAEWKWIERNEPLRAEALKRREAAGQARRDAEPLQPEVYAEAIFRDALDRQKEAEERLEQGAFDVAAEGFSTAYEAFTAAGASAAAEHIGQLERAIAEHIAQMRFREARAAVEELSELDKAKANELGAAVKTARKARIGELKDFISSELKQTRFSALEEALRNLAAIDAEEAEEWRKNVDEALAATISRIVVGIADALARHDFDAADKLADNLCGIDEAKGAEGKETIKKIREGYINQLEKNISAAVEAGHFDVARQEVGKLSVVKPDAAEVWEKNIRICELEQVIEKAISENDFAAAEDAVRALAAIDEAKGAERGETVREAKDEYDRYLKKAISDAIDNRQIETARELVKKLAAVSPDWAEKWEKAVRIRELEQSIEKAISEKDFAAAEDAVRRIGEIDEGKGTEWAEKVRETKERYISQLETAISTAIDDGRIETAREAVKSLAAVRPELAEKWEKAVRVCEMEQSIEKAISEKDFASAEKVVADLASVDEAKGTEWAEKVREAKDDYVGQLETAISKAIESGRLTVAREDVKRLSVVRPESVEKWEKTICIRELELAIEQAISVNDYTTAEEAVHALAKVDGAKGVEWAKKIREEKNRYASQMEQEKTIGQLVGEITDAVAKKSFVRADVLLLKLRALDPATAQAQVSIVRKAKSEHIQELESGIREYVSQSRFKEARELARQLHGIDGVRGEACENDIRMGEEEEVRNRIKVIDDYIRRYRFAEARAAIYELSALDAETAVKMNEQVDMEEQAWRKRSQKVRKWLKVCLGGVFICLMVGGAFGGNAWWTRKKLVQEVTVLEEQLRYFDIKNMQENHLGRTFHKHVYAFNSRYEEGREKLEAGLLAEAREIFLVADKEREWLKQYAPLGKKAHGARQTAENARMTAEKSEAGQYATRDYGKAQDLFKEAEKQLNDGEFEQARTSFVDAQKAFESAAKKAKAAKNDAIERDIRQQETNIASYIEQTDFEKAERDIARLGKLNSEKANEWKIKLSNARLEKSISDHIKQKDFTKAKGNIEKLRELDAEKAEVWKKNLSDAEKAEEAARQKAERIRQLEQSISDHIKQKEFTKAKDYIEKLRELDAEKALGWKIILSNAEKAEEAARQKAEHIRQLEQSISGYIKQKEFTKGKGDIETLRELDAEKAEIWKKNLIDAEAAEEAARQKAERIRQLEQSISGYITQKEFTKGKGDIETLRELNAEKAEVWKKNLIDAEAAEEEARQKAERIRQLERSISENIQQNEFAKAEGDIKDLEKLNAEKAAEWKEKLKEAREAYNAKGDIELSFFNQSNKINMILKPIRAWSFMMGSPEDESGRDEDENRHNVKLTKDYWLGETEVTQGQWKAVMGTTLIEQANKKYPGKGDRHIGVEDDDYPMYLVSWHDAMEFCRKLTEKERKMGRLPIGYEYSLPTEAQWEYACRAGTDLAIYNGRINILGKYNAKELDEIAWYGGNSSVGYEGPGWETEKWKGKQYPGGLAGPRKVGGKKANRYGLHDMLGNVWEWCRDVYEKDYASDPEFLHGQPSGDGMRRMFRGGSWSTDAAGCRSSQRGADVPAFCSETLGFRVALVPVGEMVIDNERSASHDMRQAEKTTVVKENYSLITGTYWADINSTMFLLDIAVRNACARARWVRRAQLFHEAECTYVYQDVDGVELKISIREHPEGGMRIKIHIGSRGNKESSQKLLSMIIDELHLLQQ